MKPKWASLIRGFSEFCATSLFMMISCMGYTIEGEVANRHVITSLVTGLAVVTTLHIFGFMSGAHTNPCVSIACYLLGYIRFSMMLLYVACQFVGCAFGYFLLLQMLPRSMIAGVVEPMKNISDIQIVAIEAFLTATLVFAWCALWDVRSGRSLDSVALRMGCQVAVCTLVGVQLTGAAMNPAKLLIPTLFAGNPQSVLLQLAGELMASIVVPKLWKFAYTPNYSPLELHGYETI